MHSLTIARNGFKARIVNDADLQRLATKVGAHLLDAERRLVTAESCSGGWIGKVLTDIPGSSGFYLGGVVSYSNTLKQALLGVLPSTLARHGAVSEATVREMAIGALETLGGHIAIAVTGIAGPEGAQPGKPVGTVWFAWAWRQGEEIESRTALDTFSGDRESVRRQTVSRALGEILSLDV
jgi:nicotinamide-nucleotide amidase